MQTPTHLISLAFAQSVKAVVRFNLAEVDPSGEAVLTADSDGVNVIGRPPSGCVWTGEKDEITGNDTANMTNSK
jgi:hypothetical protein